MPSTMKQPVFTTTGNSGSVENRLQISEERFRSIADNNNVWLWEIDPLGTYIFVSQAVENILGYAPSEVVGFNYLAFVDPQDKPSIEQIAQQAQQKQPFLRVIFRGVHKNGQSIWLSSSGFPITDDQGQIKGGKGTGYGLYLIKRTCEIYGWQIQETGQAGKGVCFEFSLKSS